MIPPNKLQALLQKRAIAWTVVHLLIIAAFVLVLLNPLQASASGASANPTNFSVFPDPIPSQVYTDFGCTNVSCPYAMWFTGDSQNAFSGFSNPFTNTTCLILSNSYIQIDHSISDLIVNKSSDCFQNSAWRFTSGGGHIFMHDTSDDGYLSNIYVTNYPSTSVTYLPANWEGPASTHLTVSAGPYIPGSNIKFTVSWNDYLSFLPRYINFFPFGRTPAKSCASTGCTLSQSTYVKVVDNVALTATGSFDFYYKYQLGGSYNPKVFVSDFTCPVNVLNGDYDTCPKGIGSLSSPISVAGAQDQDQVYTSNTFEFAPTGTAPLVNNSLAYSWNIQTSLCTDLGSSIGWRTLFQGYPDGDSETNISTNSGSGTIVYTHSIQDFPGTKEFYPYIMVGCANGQTIKLYNGSTLYQERAKGLQVTQLGVNPNTGLTTNFGGTSTDYNNATGSGAYFFTNKQFYNVNESVYGTLYYDVPFTPARVEIYATDQDAYNTNGSFNDNSKGIVALTGALLHNKQPNPLVFSYTNKEIGNNWPLILVEKSGYSLSDPTTYRAIYLGGNSHRDPQLFLKVAETTVTGNPNNTNFTGTGAGGLFVFSSNEGIFGLDPSTFRVSFGSTSNFLLVWAADLVNVMISAALYIAIEVWNILRVSPIFSLIDSAWHPVAGSTHTLPMKIFNQPVTFSPDDRVFTIAYANETDSKYLSWFTMLFIYGEIMLIILRSIFSAPGHVRRH